MKLYPEGSEKGKGNKSIYVIFYKKIKTLFSENFVLQEIFPKDRMTFLKMQSQNSIHP